MKINVMLRQPELRVARNVVNLPYLEGVLKHWSIRVPPSGAKWIQTTLRKWFLNEAPAKRVTKVQLGSPPWLKAALERGEPVWDVYAPAATLRDIENVVDWFKADPVVASKPVLNMTFEQAKQHAKEFRENLAKQEQRQDGKVEPIKVWKDGWRLVRLVDKKAFQREGRLMKHCVGDELQQYFTKSGAGSIRILSLRDPNNQPHATLEYQVKKKRVAQIKGKANGPIQQAYVARLKQWLKKPGKGYKIDTVEDLINMGIIEQEGRWYSIHHIPTGFVVKGDLDLYGTKITSLPAGLKVEGNLDLQGTKITSLPAGLTVGGDLYLRGTKITSLPAGLKVDGSIFVDHKETFKTSSPALREKLRD